MGSFPSRRAADWCVCTMSLYIGASRRLIGTRAPIYRRVACNELSLVGQNRKVMRRIQPLIAAPYICSYILTKFAPAQPVVNLILNLG